MRSSSIARSNKARGGARLIGIWWNGDSDEESTPVSGIPAQVLRCCRAVLQDRGEAATCVVACIGVPFVDMTKPRAWRGLVGG